jgi:SAM-dependent methyltransferase
MPELNQPDLTVAALEDRIRGRANDLLGFSAEDCGPGGTASNLSREYSLAQLELQPPFDPSPNDCYHVNELLKYHDRNFIQNAYRAILKRGPDTTGFEAFASRLRSGQVNKVDILARLRYSKEGRSKGVKIEGLFMPAAIRQAYRIPILGYVLQWFVALLRLPSSQRSQQQFEAHEMAQKIHLVDFVNELSRQIRTEAKSRIEKLDTVSSQLEMLRQTSEHSTAEFNHALDGLKSAQLELDSNLRSGIESLKSAQFELDSDLRSGIEILRLAQIEANEDFRRDIVESTSGLRVELQNAIVEERSARERLATEQHESLDRLLLEYERAGNEQAAREHELHTLIANAASRERAFSDEMQVRLNSLRQDSQVALDAESVSRRELGNEVMLQGLRLSRALDSAGMFSTGSELQGHPPVAGVDRNSNALDAFYAALEERFRGDVSEVRRRLSIYLPYLRIAGIGSKERSVLDLGCGRGEWLEVLGEEGIAAAGVDLNLHVVGECRGRGLDVAENDAITYLSSRPDKSAGAVTGFHIVEHLPLESIIRLIDESFRVLDSGGLLIFETPNPENIQVGACNFYLDPTHRNPIPPPVLKFFLESRGFEQVEVLRLNPSIAEPVDGDSDLVQRFNKLFYGPMDYAVIGRRGGA